MMNDEMLREWKIEKKGASSWPALVPVPMFFFLRSNDYFSPFLIVFFLSRVNLMTPVNLTGFATPSK
jgi:hypothetical protein